MDFGDIIDGDVITSPAYWLLSAGALIALLIGFSLQSSWGTGSMPLISKIFTLLMVPVAAYFITLMIGNK